MKLKKEYVSGELITITKRLCSDKVQPKVKVGANYFVMASGKLKSGATVLKVAEFGEMYNKALANPHGIIKDKDTIRINEERFEWVRKDKKKLKAEFLKFKEEFYKQQEEKDDEYIKSKFTERERIQMAYHPYIYAELSWYYAEKAMEIAKEQRIERLKKVSREVKLFRTEFTCELKKKMSQNIIEYAREKVMEIMNENSQNFLIFFLTIKNELNRQHAALDVEDIIVYAYMSDLCYRAQRKLDERNVEIIRKRIGQASHHESYKYMKELNDCMHKVIGDIKIEYTQPIKTVESIMGKYIGEKKL